MRRTRIAAPALTLLAALTATACDSDPGEKLVQRDVYTGNSREDALEKCVADWGNQALCQQQLDDAEKQRVASSGSSGIGNAASHMFMIWGPGYSGPNRAVSYGGQTVIPATQRAVQTAAFTGTPGGRPVTSSFSAPKPAGVSSGFTSRGGFGAAGRGVSGGG